MIYSIAKRLMLTVIVVVLSPVALVWVLGSVWMPDD